MAWWSVRGGARGPLARRDWTGIVALGFIGYYLASLLDFMGLEHITAALERLVLFLYPTMVVLLSALLLGKTITRRAVAALLLSYAGIVLVFAFDLRTGGDPAALWAGGALVFASAVLYAVYLVYAGDIIGRVGSMRFISWAMLASTLFVLTQFVLTREVSALVVPPSIYAITLAMAVFSTVLPTWLIAESIRRIGANASSLIGSLGPVFTIGLAAAILGEPVNAIQLGGAALVLVGVTLVTLKSGAAGAARAPVAAPPAES
jgi:drug/metabolite transporter (DMT)-like permease